MFLELQKTSVLIGPFFLTDVVVLVATVQSTTSKQQSHMADNDNDNQVSLCSIGHRMEKRHISQGFHKDPLITTKSFLTDQPICVRYFKTLAQRLFKTILRTSTC